MFGFFSPLPIAAPLFSIITASGTVTFSAMTMTGSGTVPSASTGSSSLLMRRIPPRYLVTQNLLRRRNY